jgi:hypothetical protein
MISVFVIARKVLFWEVVWWWEVGWWVSEGVELRDVARVGCWLMVVVFTEGLV